MFTRRIFGYLCTTPQFRLFLNAKRQQQIEGLQCKVFELRTLVQHTQDPQIVADQKGVCSEQLSDKLRLTNVQLKVNKKLDDDLKKEILQLNLSELHFRNVIGPSLSKSITEFLTHQLRYRLYRTRLDLSICSNTSEATLRDYCEIFKQSALFVHDYQRKHGIELLCSEDYNRDLAQYHRFLGYIAQYNDHIQEAIINFEKAITYIESSRDTVQWLISNGDPNATSHQSSKLQELYHFIADVFKSLGLLQFKIGVVEVARKYLTKAIEIYSKIFGTHSIQYVELYCDLAYTYKSENPNLCTKMISDQFETLKGSENQESFLHVCLVKFILLSEQDNDVEMLILYIQITQQLQSTRVYNNQIEFLFHFLAMPFTHHTLSQSESYHHTICALYTLQQFSDSERSMQVIQIIKQVQNEKFDNHDYYFIVMNYCLQMLENQTHRIEFLKDHRLEEVRFQIYLFEIEHQILRLRFILWYQIDVKIEDFWCQLQKFINHFRRIPEIQIKLLQNIAEFVSFFCISGFKDYAAQLVDQMFLVSRLIEDENTANEFQSQVQQVQIRWLSD